VALLLNIEEEFQFILASIREVSILNNKIIDSNMSRLQGCS
jgi:hypothetical protein